MDVINDKKDAKWRKLRKQRIATQARMRNCNKSENVAEQNQMLNKVIKATLALTGAVLPQYQVNGFLNDVGEEVPGLKRLFKTFRGQE